MNIYNINNNILMLLFIVLYSCTLVDTFYNEITNCLIELKECNNNIININVNRKCIIDIKIYDIVDKYNNYEYLNNGLIKYLNDIEFLMKQLNFYCFNKFNRSSVFNSAIRSLELIINSNMVIREEENNKIMELIKEIIDEERILNGILKNKKGEVEKYGILLRKKIKQFN